MNHNIVTYSIYLPLSIAITIWVAKVLFKNGKIFLIEIFHQDEALAEAVNKLLLVGFYLLNFGYICFMMQENRKIVSYQEVFEILSIKIGAIILILGIVHFLNLYVFFKLRNKAKQALTQPVLYPATEILS